MVWVKMKHVNAIKGRNGKVYYYHRPTGTRLPDNPESVEFARKLEGLNTKDRPTLAKEGTISDLVLLYKKSPRFLKLADRTRADYNKRLDYLSETFGDIAVRDWTAEEVLDLQDALSDAPRQADYMVQVLSILFSFARKRPSRFKLNHNPASGVERIFSAEGYKPWPDNLIAAFRKKAYRELRWIVEGALYTGQRQGDLIKMAWSSFDGQGINVVQNKTGEKLWIPCHVDLLNVLAMIPKRATVIFADKRNKPWGIDHLRHEITRVVRECGFEGYSMHGLRYNAARNLADAGCPSEDIMAVTGHRTHQMVRRYTRDADQKARALRAIERLETGTKLQNTADKTAKHRKDGV